MNRIIQASTNFLIKGHERSIRAKKNILASLLIRGSSIAISLLLVPLTINYINPNRYGIWLTLSSIVAWFSFFDIGLTQGLRNKFAIEKARGNDEAAQILVSTTYILLTIIFALVWIIFIIINPFLNWSQILNTPDTMMDDISILAIIVFTYFCLQFILRIITTLLIADQQPAKSSAIDFCGQLLSLIFIAILVKTTEGSLIRLGIALCLSPLIVLVASNLFFFNGIYKKYRPRLAKVNFSYAKGLFNLGFVFFIIQVASIIQYQTANLIIAQYFSPSDVTSYNVVYKYFGVLSMIFMIFLSPFWSASTEAFQKNDIKWIKNGIRKYNKLNLGMFVIGCIMLLFSETVYRLWLGEGTVEIGFKLSLWGFIFFNIGMFGSKYVNFLNGINALRIQFWTSLVSPVIYIVISLILINKFNLGVYSLFIAAVLANVNAFLMAPLQYYQIIIKGKRGIWIK